MRGAGGMILSYGGLIGKAGDFELTHFGRIDELALDEPVDPSFVPVAPGRLPAALGRVRPALQVAQRHRRRRLHDGGPRPRGHVRGADRAAGRRRHPDRPRRGWPACSRPSGPVEVKGLGTVGVDNLVPLVLHEAYIRYQGIERAVRRAARTSPRPPSPKLVNGQYESVRAIGTALADAVQGRHLMFHTWHPDVQERVGRPRGRRGAAAAERARLGPPHGAERQRQQARLVRRHRAGPLGRRVAGEGRARCGPRSSSTTTPRRG